MSSGLRRLKLEDLLSKVEQIDEQAALTLSEYPHGHTLERQRLIIAIARQIRSHLADQLRTGERESLKRPAANDRPRVAVLGD